MIFIMYISIQIYPHKQIFPAKNQPAHVLCSHGLGCKKACCHGYFDNPGIYTLLCTKVKLLLIM